MTVLAVGVVGVGVGRGGRSRARCLRGGRRRQGRRRRTGVGNLRVRRAFRCLLATSVSGVVSCGAGGFVPPHELVEHGMFSLGAQVCA